MPVPRSSSPSGRAGILGVAALAALVCCTARTVWRVPVDELVARLGSGDHSFLLDLDYRAVDLREVTRLGREAPYYLAQVFRSLSMPAVERQMVSIGREVSRGAFREECDLRLLEILLAEGRWPQAAELADAAAARIVEPVRAARLGRLRLEALHRLGRDAELLGLLDAYLLSMPDPAAARGADPELVFYEAAASARLDRPGWVERFRELAWSYRSSFAHVRAFGFLEGDPERRASFPGAEMELLRGKVALAEGRLEAAAVLLGDALGSLCPPPGSVVVDETARAFLSLGRYTEGLLLLEELEARAAEPWVVLELEGRLLRASGARSRAALAFEAAARSARDPAARRRAAWLELDLRMDGGERQLGRLFLNRREYLDDASYFEDVLEEAVTLLLGFRSWSELETLRDVAREAGALATVARADFILARAVATGLLAASPARDPDFLLDEAIACDPMGYHGLLAGELRSVPFRRLEADREPAADGAAAQVGARPASAEAGAFVEGFFRYGLPMAGYRAVLARLDTLPEEIALGAAEELQHARRPAESIRLAAALSRRGGVTARRRVDLLQYPALYVDGIEPMASELDLPVRAVLALVREESLFDPAIVSPAGAVGLMQLLPATAEEVASRRREAQPDLKDPRTNLRLGLRHLAGLRASTRSLLKATAAYNAGLGRLRRWERELAGLSDELFAEAIPFAETRQYVRRVVVGAAMYGALYEGAAPAETVRLYFPHLAPPPAD